MTHPTDEELDALVEYLRGKGLINQRESDAITALRAKIAAANARADRAEAALAALTTPAPDAVQEAAIDIAAIENGGKRWHGEDHRVVAVRWEPYKPDGQRQMKAKGRWQEQVGSGDYWRWQNCDRPAALAKIKGADHE